MGDTEFQTRYPTIWWFLDPTLWPDVDSYNLLEMLHRTMKGAPAAWTQRLVDEFQKLGEDDSLEPAYLAELFSREIPERYRVVTENNARALFVSLAEYVRYLYDQEGIHGRA